MIAITEHYNRVASTSLVVAALLLASALALADNRNIRTGREIPTETYADQPYVVKTNDGAWLVCVTTGAGLEGQAGQHVVTVRTTDQGRTWQPPVDVELAGGPEASYAVMLKAPGGRVYIFYNHNTDNLRQVKGARTASSSTGSTTTVGASFGIIRSGARSLTTNATRCGWLGASRPIRPPARSSSGRSPRSSCTTTTFTSA